MPTHTSHFPPYVPPSKFRSNSPDDDFNRRRLSREYDLTLEMHHVNPAYAQQLDELTAALRPLGGHI